MANTNILLVGYTLAVREDLHGLVPNWPELTPATLPEELAVRTAERDTARNIIRAGIAEDPSVHLCTLRQVVIADPQREQIFDSAKIADKSAVMTTAGWLMDNYPDAWGATPFDYRQGPPAVSFYGFDMRLFIKILGIQAAAEGRPLPAGLWYENKDHRDMEGALLPSQCTAKKFTMMQAMDAMGMLLDPLNPIAPDWKPRVNPIEDVRIIAEIATRLGLLLVKKQEKVTKPKPAKK